MVKPLLVPFLLHRPAFQGKQKALVFFFLHSVLERAFEIAVRFVAEQREGAMTGSLAGSQGDGSTSAWFCAPWS